MSKDPNPDCRSIDDAKNLLRRALTALEGEIENVDAETAEATHHPSEINTPVRNDPDYSRPGSSKEPSNTSQSLSQEYSKLFFQSRKRNKSATTTPKRVKTESPRTWTHKFFCLASRDQTTLPTLKEKEALRAAGLGEAKLRIPVNAGWSQVKSFLCKQYPKLKEAGAFDVLRLCGRSQLKELKMPKGGYSVDYLKNRSDLGQAVAYIRPIQTDLDMTAIVNPDETEAIEICKTCQKEIPVSDLKHHIEVCLPIDAISTDSEKSAEDSQSEDEIEKITHHLSTDDNIDIIQQICPNKSRDDINFYLNLCKNDLDQTIHELTRIRQPEMTVDQGTLESHENYLPPDVSGTETELFNDPQQALNGYRNQQRNNSSVNRILINRLNDKDKVVDILTFFKSCDNLRCEPKVRFENEEGLGLGPQREFMSLTLNMITEGFNFNGQQISIFEGQDDHKLPVPDIHQLQCGMYEFTGKVIGHSTLWGGPFLFGLSKAAYTFWTTGADSLIESNVLQIEDIAEFELRGFINQLTSLNRTEPIPEDLREELSPFMLEAKINTLTSDNKMLVAEQLMLYHTIIKRKPELISISNGMDAVSLTTFLKSNNTLLEVIFPRVCQQVIDLTQFHTQILADVKTDLDHTTLNHFNNYLTLCATKFDGKGLHYLLQFWTGHPFLPSTSVKLKIIFDEEIVLPKAYTCFNRLSLPTGISCYDTFVEKMDKALELGLMGFSFQ